MYLHIRSDIDSSYSDMCRKISEYRFPAIILDNDRYIRERNEYAGTAVIPVRKGARIDRYLSVSDAEEVKALRKGEQTEINLGFPSVFGTVIFRAEDYYLLVGREFTVLLRKHVSELYSRMPGYDRCISIGMERAGCGSDRNALKKCFGDITRMNFHLKEFFRTVSGDYHSDSVPFNVVSACRNVVSCAKRIIKPFCIRESGFQNGDAIFTLGSEDDFIMLLSAVIAFSVKYNSRDRMSVSLENRSGEIRVRACFDSTMEKETVSKLSESRFRSEDFGKENGILFFDIYLLELIADRNMWDFAISESFDVCGRLIVSLTVPEYKERKAGILRDSCPSELSAIVRRELCGCLLEE